MYILHCWKSPDAKLVSETALDSDNEIGVGDSSGSSWSRGELLVEYFYGSDRIEIRMISDGSGGVKDSTGF